MMSTVLCFRNSVVLVFVDHNTMMFGVQTQGVCLFALWAKILATGPTVVFSGTRTLEALTHVDLGGYAYRCHVGDSEIAFIMC